MQLLLRQLNKTKSNTDKIERHGRIVLMPFFRHIR
jgi:hypothetical protein